MLRKFKNCKPLACAQCPNVHYAPVVQPSRCVITDSEGDVKQTVKELIERHSNIVGRAPYKVCLSDISFYNRQEVGESPMFWDERSRNHGSIPHRDKREFLFHKISRPLLGLTHWVPGSFTRLEVKRPEREAAHLSLYSVEIKI